MSLIGTEPPIRDVRCSVAIEGKADVHRPPANRRERPFPDIRLTNPPWRAPCTASRNWVRFRPPRARGFPVSAERVERKLAAILAADVAGYSRLMGSDEEGTL